MADGEGQGIVRRMVEAGRPRSDPTAMSIAKAAGAALSKVAEAQMKLALQVTDAAEVPLSLTDLPDAIEDGALLLILGGPDGSSGLLAVSPVLLAALIERRTMGRIGTHEVPQRRPTRTDSAIAVGYFDPVLAVLAEVLSGTPDGMWAAGYRFAAVADDTRSVLLRLDDTQFRGLRMQVRLTEAGSRTGGFLLVLPALMPAARLPASEPAACDGVAPATPSGEAADWAARIEAAVMDAPTVVTGVLWRINLSLTDVLSLAPGAAIPVPHEALDRIPLEASDGRVLARGRLGQSRGHRAIRVRIGDADGGASDGERMDGAGGAGQMRLGAQSLQSGMADRHGHMAGGPSDTVDQAAQGGMVLPTALDAALDGPGHSSRQGAAIPMALDMALGSD